MDDQSTYPHGEDTSSVNLALDAVVARVSAHPETVGIIALGSAADNTMTVASDYDLVVVLDDVSIPMTLILTRIDRRVAEIVLTALCELERMLSDPATDAEGSWEASVARRLADGRILFDRDGALGQVQASARVKVSHLSISDAQRYDAWFNANYSLRMLMPMVAADDPVHRFATRYRLHAQVGNLCVRYFTIRRLPWRGEKIAYRYLRQHDPAFLTLLEDFLSETNTRTKAEMYRELVRLALAPAGGLWDDNMVVADAPLAHVEEILARWNTLLSPLSR